MLTTNIPESEHPKSTTGASRPTIGRIVHFIESGEPHAALVCFVNDDATLNLLVLGYEGNTFPRTNVRQATIIAPSGRDNALCEQRWFWPPRG